MSRAASRWSFPPCGSRVTGREPDHGPAPTASPAPVADAPRRMAEERPVDVPPARPPLEHEGPPGKLDRRALHEVAPSGFDRLARWASQRMKSPDEVAEELIDERLSGRHILTRANLVAVVSPKGGPGKSTLTAILGDALSRSLPNSRVLAVDCNPGGGTLGLMAPEQRAARFTLLDLYEHRADGRDAGASAALRGRAGLGPGRARGSAGPGSGAAHQARALHDAAQRVPAAQLRADPARHLPGHHLAGDPAGACRRPTSWSWWPSRAT